MADLNTKSKTKVDFTIETKDITDEQYRDLVNNIENYLRTLALVDYVEVGIPEEIEEEGGIF